MASPDRNKSQKGRTCPNVGSQPELEWQSSKKGWKQKSIRNIGSDVWTRIVK